MKPGISFIRFLCSFDEHIHHFLLFFRFNSEDVDERHDIIVLRDCSHRVCFLQNQESANFARNIWIVAQRGLLS